MSTMIGVQFETLGTSIICFFLLEAFLLRIFSDDMFLPVWLRIYLFFWRYLIFRWKRSDKKKKVYLRKSNV